MQLLRRHPYLITLALLLVVFPVPAYAVGQELIYELVVGVFGMFVRLAAAILNSGVNTFVIGFGDVYAKTGVGYAVDTTWIIIRDFVNMAFIFGFVYIGFKMILNSNDSNTRRWLVNLLLAALLVNFSLFVTKVTIDFSNQLASQIVVGGLGSEGQTVNSKGLVEVDIGQSFMNRMGITSIFGIDSDVVMPPGTSWGYIFGSAILFMITAFVFAAGGILLIIRFAVLNLFLVLSPLMFLSWILPPLKETMNRYWGMFLGRVFFAPIYLLFIYFSLQIITGLQTAIGDNDGNGNGNLANPDWAGTFQAAQSHGANIQESTLGTLPFFVLICIFMIASLVIAQKMGADGGARAVALGKSLSNKTQRFAARNTVGYGARALNRASEGAQAGYQRLDARMSQTGLGRFTRGAISVASLGALSDRGVQGALGAGQRVSVAGSETAEQVRKREADRQNLQNRTNREIARARDFGTNHGIGEDVDGVQTPEAKEEAKNKMAAVIREMSDDELKGLSLEQLKSNTVAGHLSDAQIKMLSESGLHSNDAIKGLKESRNNATFSDVEATLDGTGKEFADAGEEAKALEEAFESLGKTIKGMGDDRLTGLGAERLTNKRYAAHLSDTQIESLQKSGKYSIQDIDNIKKARSEGLQNSAGIGAGASEFFKGRHAGAATSAATGRAEKLFQRNVQEAGKLPPEMFTDSNMAKHITPQALEQRIRNGVTNAEAAEIKRSLDMHINGLGFNDPARKAWESWSDRSVNAARIDLNI